MKLWLTSSQSQAESGLKFRPSRHLAAMIYTSNYPVMLGFCGTTAARSYELNFEIIKHDALFARHQHRSSFLYIKTVQLTAGIL